MKTFIVGHARLLRYEEGKDPWAFLYSEMGTGIFTMSGLLASKPWFKRHQLLSEMKRITIWPT